MPITTQTSGCDLSPRISIRTRCTTLCDKVCQWLATGRWFSRGPLVSSTKNEILLKVVLYTVKAVSSNPAHSEVYLIQHYVIKFVSDLQQVGGFLWVLLFPPPIKLTATSVTMFKCRSGIRCLHGYDKGRFWPNLRNCLYRHNIKHTHCKVRKIFFGMISLCPLLFGNVNGGGSN